MKHIATKSIFFLGILMNLSYVFSQNTPVVNYSRATQAFDGIVPFGKAFQIKGYIPSDVQAVKIESFGFLKEETKINSLQPFFLGRDDDEGRTFCEGLAEARLMGLGRSSTNQIPYTNLAWERHSGNSNATQFTVNHPQLYFGRTYVFLVSYYEAAGDAEVNGARELYKSIIEITLTGKTNGEISDILDNKELNQKISAVSISGCDEVLVSKQTLSPAYEIALNDIRRVINDQMVENIQNGNDRRSGTPSSNAIAAILSNSLNPPPSNPILSVSSTTPYLENLDAQNKFLISLDGGLVYVSDFEQLIPIIGFNLKINPIDFNDPFNTKNEWSVILGLGMSSPDDLDPDYEGIFSGSNRSLITGLIFR
ncbi:MAG: hypothetical protein AAF391_08015, partial [Bacteroidota bacterium]